MELAPSRSKQVDDVEKPGNPVIAGREPIRVAAAQASSEGGDEPLQQPAMRAEATLHRIGDDYVAASGAVRSEAGTTTRAVSITVLEDAHHEGSETMVLKLSEPFGAQVSDTQATGTIVNTDPVLKAWLARFGRTVAGHFVDAIGSRFERPAQ